VKKKEKINGDKKIKLKKKKKDNKMLSKKMKKR
jgi:hypothetical protein